MADKETTYQDVLGRIEALADGETDPITLMSTISCEVFHAFDHFHWVGFYRLVNPQTLKVGPYQGGHGCLTIDINRGVCGACARENATQIENDISQTTDHIACSSETQAEIVLPVRDADGNVTAVFDIDSTTPNCFDDTDLKWLEKITAMLVS
ncbi:MAG: GAF domain-containing protein [Verrucomicrobiales bacterium]|nr:GAF domain-containing protein [Verrucomicrobiota bacterium JB025]